MNRRGYLVLSIILTVLAIAATAGFAYVALFVTVFIGNTLELFVVIGCATALYFIFPVHILVHELGHLFFGGLSGMSFPSVQVGRLRVIGKKVRFVWHTRGAGETVFYPKNVRNLRRKTVATAVGGAVFNFIYFLLMLALVVLSMQNIVKFNPALCFFAMFAPFSLTEGILALVPSTLYSGKTDGEIIRSLTKKTPEAVVTLNVLTAQGILRKKGYGEIPRELLFDLPVVREDEPCFLALLQLQWRYSLMQGDVDGALFALGRLGELCPYLGDAECGEVSCDLLYAFSVLSPDKEVAAGLLEEAKFVDGTLAYARARFAYAVAFEENKGENYLAQAEELLQKEKLFGVKEFERKQLDDTKKILSQDTAE